MNGEQPYEETRFLEEQRALSNANQLGYRDGIRAGILVGMLAALCMALVMNWIL